MLGWSYDGTTGLLRPPSSLQSAFWGWRLDSWFLHREGCEVIGGNSAMLQAEWPGEAKNGDKKLWWVWIFGSWCWKFHIQMAKIMQTFFLVFLSGLFWIHVLYVKMALMTKQHIHISDATTQLLHCDSLYWGVPVFSLRAWYVHLLGRKAAFAIAAGVEVLSCDAPSPFPSEMTKSDVSER